MKRTLNNMLTAISAIMLLTLASCAKSDNYSQPTLPPVVGQWVSISEEGYTFFEDGETVESYFCYDDDEQTAYFFDETGAVEDIMKEEGKYEPCKLTLKTDGTLDLISREGKMNCSYQVKDNRIVLPEWGDELVWNYTMDGDEMLIEQQIYNKGILYSLTYIHYQRK